MSYIVRRRLFILLVIASFFVLCLFFFTASRVNETPKPTALARTRRQRPCLPGFVDGWMQQGPPHFYLQPTPGKSLAVLDSCTFSGGVHPSREELQRSLCGVAEQVNDAGRHPLEQVTVGLLNIKNELVRKGGCSCSSARYNVGLLVMATGKYIGFWEQLYESAQKYFMRDHAVTYFLYTDATIAPKPDVVVIKAVWRGWPHETFVKVRVPLDNEAVIKEHKIDFLYILDADMLFVGDVGSEALGLRVATQHPGYYARPRKDLPFETRAKSAAFVEPHEGIRYYQASFFGGATHEVLRLVRILDRNIRVDEANGVEAVWHDESHLNRYLIDHPPTVALSPVYTFHEQDLTSVPDNLPGLKILSLDKDIDELRVSP